MLVYILCHCGISKHVTDIPQGNAQDWNVGLSGHPSFNPRGWIWQGRFFMRGYLSFYPGRKMCSFPGSLIANSE